MYMKKVNIHLSFGLKQAQKKELISQMPFKHILM